MYLVKEISDTSTGQSLHNTVHGDGSDTGRSGSNTNSKSRQGSTGKESEKREMVLKVTSILSRQQRDIAEKEAKLLSRLSHPSIIKMYDTCYRTVQSGGGGGFRSSKDDSKNKDRPQHLILMELCEGGHSLEVCNEMAAAGERFDLSTLIIAFGQICNAVSYLHAQRPPIVHRDLKPANFLVKNGAYKLCDFGSAVFGHVDLKTQQARAEAEEVIEKTTTQMFRSPEMVDLYMAKKLTQATDVWALGACLYSLAFLQNCFEEGSNLAILSNKYKIPEDNPYGDGLVELLDRMLTIDTKSRADMTEVILCLSAVYSGRPLPPRKERSKKDKDKKDRDKDKSDNKSVTSKMTKGERAAGTFRTDGQGIYDGEDLELDPAEALAKKTEVKKLNPNSAAARRRQQAGGSMATDTEFASFHSKFDEVAAQAGTGKVNQDLAFSTTANPFASAESGGGDATEENAVFGSFEATGDGSKEEIMNTFGNVSQDWTAVDLAALVGKEDAEASGEAKSDEGRTKTELKRHRSRSVGRRTSSKDDKPRRRVPSKGAGLRNGGAKATADKGAESEKRRQRSSSNSRGLKKKHAERQTKKDSENLTDSMQDLDVEDDDDDAQIAAAAEATSGEDGGDASQRSRRTSGKPRRTTSSRESGLARKDASGGVRRSSSGQSSGSGRNESIDEAA